MESGAITDGQISASSEWNSSSAASQARLHSLTAWIAKDSNNSWLQVNLNSVYRVTRVATQGIDHHADHVVYHRWVAKYKLQYRNDTESFQYYKEPGQNTDKVKLT